MTLKTEKKPIYKTSLLADETLYEMAYDAIAQKTYFYGCDKAGNVESQIEEVTHRGILYAPLPANNDLVAKKVILFPSEPQPYESEEQILKEIRTFINTYLDVSEVFEQIATYYVLFTWLYDRFNEVPYLRAIGDYGSGKSRLLHTVGSLAYKPIFTAGATTVSPIFRILDESKGTLVLDEADFGHSDMTSDIVKVLNTGYQRGTPVLRAEGKGTYDLRTFEVFGPKIVATRETFKDKALESRFFFLDMGSSSLRKDIPRTLDESFYQQAQQIRNKLLMWRFDNYFKPLNKREELIEGIHPRLNQIVVPLLTIIKDLGIREQLKGFIVKYNSELVADRGMSWESDIVLAVLRLEYQKKLTEPTVKEITDELNREIDIGEDTLQPRKVGWYLRAKLQLKTEKTRRGFILNIARNRKRLDMWKERYGITVEDISGEDENVVNVVEETKNCPMIDPNDPEVNPFASSKVF
mgnify:FL=1